MSIFGILKLLPSIFKFFDEVSSLIKMLKGTPEEHHDKIMTSVQTEAAKYQDTGRPTW